MKLSAATFEAIVSSLRSDEKSSKSDKRTEPRVGVRGQVRIVMTRPGKGGAVTLPMAVRDVSSTGIGIIHSEPVALGTQFLLLLEPSDPTVSTPTSILCTIVRCRAVAAKLFSLGATFVREVASAAA